MEQQITYKIKEMAGRIRELREITGLTEEEMARLTDVSLEEYRLYESGRQDYLRTKMG